MFSSTASIRSRAGRRGVSVDELLGRGAIERETASWEEYAKERQWDQKRVSGSQVSQFSGCKPGNLEIRNLKPEILPSHGFPLSRQHPGRRKERCRQPEQH